MAHQLVRDGVWGQHPRLGRAEVRAASHTVAVATRADVEDVLDALAVIAGPQQSARATIDPDRAAAAACRAGAHLAELARVGARLAFATATPASLLSLHETLAVAARTAGARVSTAREAGPYASGRRLWWHDAVAVATDGRALVEEHRAAAADEWLLAVGHPALVVADGVFAAHAIAAGIPTIAFTDLDEPGPALDARLGRAVLVVPAAGYRPPTAYEALAGLIVGTLRPVPVTHDGDGARLGPHLATETPFPYAAPPSGEG
ncbi:MAG TPA: phosphatase [Acidimicrobiia bacterium]|nr:phosphatase [Acidimicrobiia bacterium]